MPPTQALFDLQGIDLEFDLRDARLEEIRRLLGDDRELRVMRHEAARLRAAAKAASAAQAELDQTVAGFTSHIEQVEAKLYGGHVTSSRELQDLQADVAMIKRQRGVEEEKLLVVLVDLEQAETGLKEATDLLAATQAAWDVDQASMIEERGALEREVADLRSQRASRAAKIPAPELALYERVRKRHAGRAVARLRNGACDSCRVALPTRQAQLVRTSPTPAPCPNCGLLLLPE